MAQETILLGKAIEQMKLSTEKGIPFSFSYCTLNRKKHSSIGEKKVVQARIRSKATISSQLLEYYDITEQLNRHCYISLLMTFEGKQIVI